MEGLYKHLHRDREYPMLLHMGRAIANTNSRRLEKPGAQSKEELIDFGWFKVGAKVMVTWND